MKTTFHKIALILSYTFVLFGNVQAAQLKITQPDKQTTQNTLIIEDSVYAVVEKMPQYIGGDAARIEFLEQNIKYPIEAQKNQEQGRVIVQFVVSKTGKVLNAKVVKSITTSLDKEALRIVNSFPAWIPGELNGQKVSTYQLIPITFKFGDNPKLIVIDNLKMPLNFDINILNPTEIDTGYIIMPTSNEIKKQLINKYGAVSENGVIEIYTNRFKKIQKRVEVKTWDTIPKINPDDKNAVYQVLDVDKVPKFLGDEKGLFNFISKNLKYPAICQQLGVQGTVFVQFVVDKTGKTKDAVVKNKIHPLLATEALRVINSIPDWIPGEKHGEKVNVSFTLPLKFEIKGFGYPLENDTATDRNSLIDRQIVVLDDKILPYGFDLNWLNSSELQSYKLLIPKNIDEEKRFKLYFGQNSSRGVFVAYSKKYSSDKILDRDGDIIYEIVEQMPEFPSGEAALLKFIDRNIKYPDCVLNKNIQGIVIVKFVINSAGKIEKAVVLRGFDPECDKEAIRLVISMPTWIPGIQNGRNVSVYYTLPISFKFQ